MIWLCSASRAKPFKPTMVLFYTDSTGCLSSTPAQTLLHISLRRINAMCSEGMSSNTLGGSGMHLVRTIRLFYLDNLPDTIVPLCCCPLRCCVPELVPHFTLHAPRTALCMLFPATQRHCLGSWPPCNTLVITYAYDIRGMGRQ